MLIFLQKNADISKIKKALVLKSMFSEEAFVCVPMYQISSFWDSSNKPMQIRVKKETPTHRISL